METVGRGRGSESGEDSRKGRHERLVQRVRYVRISDLAYLKYK